MQRNTVDPTRWVTTRELGDLVGAEEWRVRRLFEDGTLPEPERFGGKRAIHPSQVPAVIDALRSRGWLPKSTGESSAPQTAHHEPALTSTSAG